MDKIIKVMVIIFPDGQTHFFKTQETHKNKSDENFKYIQKCMNVWKKRNKNRENLGTSGAVANIRMLESDYNKILPTDTFLN